MAEYIERRALMEDARHDKAIMANLAGIADIANLINDQPTADVVEVRHGEWVKITSYPMGHKCSECGYIKRYKKPYCEICGAKMDGKGEGE